MEKIVTLLATIREVGELLSGMHAQEKAENRQWFLKLLSNLLVKVVPFESMGMKQMEIFISC